MQITRSRKVSNRQANREREDRFLALADFANMGDQPEEWRTFRRRHPDFFPANLTEWMYKYAEIWAEHLSDLPPDRRPSPPLLLYRNRVQAVWTRKDPYGYSLNVIYGFDAEARRISQEHHDVIWEMSFRPFLIPGQPPGSSSIGGLPQPKQTVEAEKPLPPGQPHVCWLQGESPGNSLAHCSRPFTK